MKRSRKSNVKEMNDTEIENELLTNSRSVYFGPLVITLMKFKSIPCRVAVATSSSIITVSKVDKVNKAIKVDKVSDSSVPLRLITSVILKGSKKSVRLIG